MKSPLSGLFVFDLTHVQSILMHKISSQFLPLIL